MTKYRYRDLTGGVTRPSIERMKKHIHKIGKVKMIRGIAWLNKHGHDQWAVIVRGDKGYARFEGFLWGYGGEGPHGLLELFKELNIPQKPAEFIAFKTKSPSNKVMEFWRLECSDTEYVFTEYKQDDPITIRQGFVLEKNEDGLNCTLLMRDAA